MPRNILLPCDQLCSAYLAGQSTTMLAQRYSCSPTTIAKNLRRCGITPRDRHPRCQLLVGRSGWAWWEAVGGHADASCPGNQP